MAFGKVTSRLLCGKVTPVPGGGEQFYVISRNLNFNPGDPWSRASETLRKNKWNERSDLTPLWPQPGSVSNVQVTQATLSSIKLTFSASAYALAYQTSYARIAPDGTVQQRVTVSTGVAALETTFTGLSTYALYRFTIQAANKHAGGYEPGATIDVRVEANPPAPMVRLESVTPTSVTVSWTPPASTQPLKYFVFYVQGTTTSPESMTLLTTATLGSLVQGVAVTIFVRAMNLYGYGKAGNLTATPILTPAGRTEFFNVSLVGSMTERMVQLVFAPVAFSDRYKVTISEGGSQYVDSGLLLMDTSALVTGLLANTLYSFKVFAGNMAGFSALSLQSPDITTHGVPQPTQPPSNLRVLSVTESSVVVVWDTPSVDDKVTYFRVEKSVTSTFGAAITPETIMLNEGLTEATWQPTYNVTGLVLGTDYYFAVTARTANKLGYTGVPRALLQASTTLQPTAGVQDLKLVKIFPSSALLSFTALTGEMVTEYRLDTQHRRHHHSFSNSTLQSFAPIMLPHPSAPGTVEVTVTGLDTMSVYTFSIRARNYNLKGYSGVTASTIGDIRLMALPYSPMNLRVTAISSTSIALSWDRSQVPPLASVFRLMYRLGTSALHMQGLLELTARQVTVTGLQRGVLYDFRVFAGTLAGFELAGSDMVSAAPVSQPKEVNALIITDISLESISLRWEAATFPRATSFLLRYLDEEIETTQLTYTATALIPGQPVTFRVFARNFNELGYESKGQTAMVTPIGPPGYATTLRIVGVTSTSVTIEYDEVQLVNVTRIKVQYKRASALNWTEFAEYQCRIDEQYLNDPPSCSTTIHIDNLVLGVVYVARVLQRNSNAAGYLEQGAKQLVISPTLKPTRSVNNLEVVAVTSSAIFLEFQRPVGVDAPTHYKVVYSKAAGGAEETTPEFATSQATVQVTGLIKDVVYTMHIIGRNFNVAGYTNAVQSGVVASAPFEQPTKVSNIRNPAVAADQITIAWDLPSRGPVSLYKVEIANATVLMNGVAIDVAELGLAPSYREVGTTRHTTYTVQTSDGIAIQKNVKVILRVSARNLNLDGYGTAAEILATPTGTPLLPPRDFTVPSVTRVSMYLTWMPPLGYVLGDATVTRYILEGCAENCGTNDPFPAAPRPNAKWYVMGGSEYQWVGYQWEFTGNTFWRTIASLPHTQIAYNVTRIGEYEVEVNRDYQFRVAAGNKNTLASGPIAMLTQVTPLYPPGQARKVVISNPKMTSFALNCNPPLLSNITGRADRYRLMVEDLVTNTRYPYHTIITSTAAVVTGFNPGTEYVVTVHAGNLAGFDRVGTRASSSIRTRSTPCSVDCCEQVKGCTKCCGLMARRIQDNLVELIWSPAPNLELMHYKIKYQEYGLSTIFVEGGIVTSNRAVITGLDFNRVSDYRFLVIGGSRILNTFDADTQGVVTCSVDL